MKFFKTISDSITNRSFYHGISNHSNKQSWKYFLGLNLLSSIVIYIALVVFITPVFLVLTSKESQTELQKVFPSDLVITMKSGQLSINQPEPYTIPLPKSLQNGRNIDIKNLITINTKEDFSYEAYTDSQSFIYVTKNIVAVPDSRKGQVKINSLKSFEDVVIDQDKFISLVDLFFSFIKKAAIFALIPVFVLVFIFNTASNIIFIAVLSFVVWLIQKLTSQIKSYGAIFKEGLYLITSLVILDLLLVISGIGSITLLYIAVYLLIYQLLIGYKK